MAKQTSEAPKTQQKNTSTVHQESTPLNATQTSKTPPKAIAQQKLQSYINNSPLTERATQFQKTADVVTQKFSEGHFGQVQEQQTDFTIQKANNVIQTHVDRDAIILYLKESVADYPNNDPVKYPMSYYASAHIAGWPNAFIQQWVTDQEERNLEKANIWIYADFRRHILEVQKQEQLAQGQLALNANLNANQRNIWKRYNRGNSICYALVVTNDDLKDSPFIQKRNDIEDPLQFTYYTTEDWQTAGDFCTELHDAYTEYNTNITNLSNQTVACRAYLKNHAAHNRGFNNRGGSTNNPPSGNALFTVPVRFRRALKNMYIGQVIWGGPYVVKRSETADGGLNDGISIHDDSVEGHGGPFIFHVNTNEGT